jgi:predicted permease
MRRVIAALEPVVTDLRHALRRLAAAPGFTFAATLTLGLGIGANVAIFGLTYQVLLKPLPYADSSRLVAVWGDASYRDVSKSNVSPPDFLDWTRQTTTLSDLAAYLDDFRTTAAGDSDRPEPIDVRFVTGNFFRVLGVSPVAGRGLREEDDVPGAARVAVISRGYWQRRYGAAPNLSELFVDSEGTTYAVVGVMPPDFQYGASNTDAWIPIRSILGARDWESRTNYALEVVGRLAPTASLEQAHTELDGISRRLAATHLGPNEPRGARVIPLRDEFAGGVRRGYVVLFAGAGCLLLVACLNVAHLLLLRGAQRSRELAVRASLGASRRRLVQQLLMESAVLVGGGAVVGLWLNQWTTGFFGRLVPVPMRGVTELGIGPAVLVFAVVAAAAATCLAGLMPALRLSRARLAAALTTHGPGSVRGGSRMRSALVATEVGAAVLLLVCTGLFLATMIRLHAVDPGFEPSNLLTASLPSRQDDYLDQVLERVRTVPGVTAATVATVAPLEAFPGRFPWSIEGWSDAATSQPRALLRTAGAGYLETLGVRLRRGRMFDDGDRRGSPPVAVINDAMRRQYWGDRDPMGARITRGEPGPGAQSYTIVGVIGDVKQRSLTAEAEPEVIVPRLQYAGPGLYRSRVLIVRIAAGTSGLAERVREEIGAVDTRLALPDVVAMRDRVSVTLDERERRTVLFSAFAALGLVLSILGVYAVVSAAVTDRTQEIGVRLALGARPDAMARMLVKEGLILAGVGCAGGLLVAVGVTRTLGALLWGVAPSDPASFAAAAVLMLSVSLAACYIPARRTTKINLRTALYYE